MFLFFLLFTNRDSVIIFPGNHPCFSCKTVGRDVTRCSVSGCGCYYHEDCVRKLPGTTSSSGGGFSCPQHSCSTCCLERDVQRASKGKTTFDLSLRLSDFLLESAVKTVLHQQSVKKAQIIRRANVKAAL